MNNDCEENSCCVNSVNHSFCCMSCFRYFLCTDDLTLEDKCACTKWQMSLVCFSWPQATCLQARTLNRRLWFGVWGTPEIWSLLTWRTHLIQSVMLAFWTNYRSKVKLQHTPFKCLEPVRTSGEQFKHISNSGSKCTKGAHKESLKVSLNQK